MSDAPTARATGDRLNDAIGHLGWLLDRDRDDGSLTPGDRAELRRIDPADKPLPPAFWRVLSTSKVAAAVPDYEPARFEGAIAVVIRGIAEVGGVGEPSIGAALAASGYAEQRFVRLLRARWLRDVAHETRLAAQWCAAKGVRPRWRDELRTPNGFGPFVIDAALGDPFADRRAHAIARDYFREATRNERPPASEPTP